jgi:hypothetical protein
VQTPQESTNEHFVTKVESAHSSILGPVRNRDKKPGVACSSIRDVTEDVAVASERAFERSAGGAMAMWDKSRANKTRGTYFTTQY